MKIEISPRNGAFFILDIQLTYENFLLDFPIYYTARYAICFSILFIFYSVTFIVPLCCIVYYIRPVTKIRKPNDKCKYFRTFF